MASNEGATIPLRYWVEGEEKRVVMAEARGDFVDVLFSFLTLPLGATIFHESHDHNNQPLLIGCISNLYQSVKHLSPAVFLNAICKRMLLSPRNAFEASCQRLKLNIHNTTLPTKYFMCSNKTDHPSSHKTDHPSSPVMTTFEEATCSYCGKPMDKQLELLLESNEKPDAAKYDGVFVKGDAMFLIFDDLRVLRSTPSDSLQLLRKHRHKDFSNITEKIPRIGMQEIFNILKQALISKSPLSDAFLENRESKPSYSFSPNINTCPSHSKDYVEIKVMVSKSRNKVLFAEAGEDFVDFLVSFLTTPLGAIVNLMNGKLSLGSIDNLYESIKNLDPSWFIESSDESLLNPKVAPQFGCKSNPLNVLEEGDPPKYWLGTPKKCNMESEKEKEKEMVSMKKDLLRDPPKEKEMKLVDPPKEKKLFDPPTEMKLFDPRSFAVDTSYKYGFMKRPCLFVVTDDLKVIPMTAASSFPYLQELENFKLDDVEQHIVKIRKRSHEALNLMRASLTCKEAALTQSLFYRLRKWKCQRWIPFWGVLPRKKKKHGKTKEEKERASGKTSDMRNREKDKEVKKIEDGTENKPTLTTTQVPQETKIPNDV
ncbi:hypothetical protein Fmac_010508 [Flemingia macrophylla]|uniref:Uncharacterized protein n=1 Tax=Flemingia macrophylla TaxID=520843 RepID=A0ABD1MKI2_9FABA